MDHEHERATVMIVDDTPDNLRLLERMLQKDGYRVQVFPRAVMALKAAAKAAPDIILLDVNMPEMNGFEMCAQLKADPQLKDVPVIFISALSDTSDKVKAFSAGGVDYVTKPFQFEEVHARLTTQLQLRNQRRELQRAHDKLRELEELRDGLVNMVVHDMRLPLTILVSGLAFAQEFTLPADAAEAIADAVAGAETLTEMVKSVLDVSKMEAAQMTLAPTAVDLVALIEAEVAKFGPIIGERVATVVAQQPVGLVLCDASLVRRVVQNLVVNAVNFTDSRKGTIDVDLTTTGDSVRVTIKDNGPGIEAEHREKIFGKFYQVLRRYQRRENSSGLGLTFCKLAIETHGGRIGVDSEVGNGSAFWFELKASGPPVAAPPPDASRG